MLFLNIFKNYITRISVLAFFLIAELYNYVAIEVQELFTVFPMAQL